VPVIYELIGKEVEVNTVDIIYRGVLVELGEAEIFLSSENGWITIPMDSVVDVKAVE